MSISRSRDIFSFCYLKYFKSNYNRHIIVIVNVQLGPSPRLQMQNTSHAKLKLSNRCLDNCHFSFSSRSLQQLYDMMLSSQHSATAPWTKSVILHYFHLFPQSIHCQPVRVCFANKIEICTRFVRVVTRICQSCDMDLSKGLSKL